MSDSLDLGRLANNLPSSSGHGARAMQAAEAELQSAFRNSALCITQMLKAGQKSSKRAYQAGYTTALQDVLEYLQSSLDINVDQPRSNEDIAQVIDYIEARQQAAGLELQDIDAEDEQHQSTQQHHTSHAQTSAQASPAAPQRMQHQQSLHSHQHNPLSFRNHRQQGQQSTETSSVTPSSSSFRGLYQHHQGPIASTSSHAAGGASTSSRSTAEQRKLPQQRSTGRSLSPASNARQQSTSSSSATISYNTSQQLDGSNRSSSSNTSARSQIDPEATQDSVALASSSSIPNSPAGRRASDAHNNNNNQTRVESIDMLSTDRARQTTPPPSSSTIDPSLSTASTAVTPMTRLQAKREREKGRRNRSHHVHHDSTSTSTQASTANVHAGLKRRWTASLLPEQHTISLSMNLGSTPIASDYNVNLVSDGEQHVDEDDEDLDDGDLNAGEIEDIDSQDQLPLHGSPAQRKITLSTDDDSGMEMDDTSSYRFDGNVRPAKRLARR